MNNSNFISPLIDSHCHLNRLDLTSFEGNLDTALKAARSEGIIKFLVVSVEPSDQEILREYADTYEDIVFSVGVHPNELLDKEITTEALIAWANHPKCVAIGETGLDYYRSTDNEFLDLQRTRFRDHIAVAKQINKPLIIHTRQSIEDTLAIMREENANAIGGVMHCFTENYESAMRAIDLGFYISFSGVVTFKNAIALQEVAQKIPLDKILIETDAPFLAPVPHRGQPNHPAWVKFVAEKIAELRGISFEEVARQTTYNFYNCFPSANRD